VPKTSGRAKTSREGRPRVGVFPSFNREAALQYGRSFWNRVCSDEYVAGSFAENIADELQPLAAYQRVPRDTRFVHEFSNPAKEHAILPDGAKIPWARLDDCSHFVSCCIGAPPGSAAGGLTLPADFPAGPYGILSATRLVSHLRSSAVASVISVRDKTNPHLERIRPGDLIAYYNKDAGRFAHMAMYAGNGKIVCHTYCRSDDAACTWDNEYSLGFDQPQIEWYLIKLP
jgi:hypothetical protein